MMELQTMDEIVKQALAKWPNVPHCYGWLALDARGAWRMRDEQAQALHLPGDKIAHSALLGFINRNYMSDDRGRWYFQNGPQRVYVTLEATPYIARTDPVQGFVLHTGEPLWIIDDAWMTETGQLVLEGAGKLAMVDDRDLAQCIANLRIGGKPVGDAQLLTWLTRQDDDNHQLTLHLASRQVPVQHLANNAIAARFGFIPIPQPDAPASK
jgi:hypothetical protein